MAKPEGSAPVPFSQELADQICSRIRNGSNLKKLSETEGFPSRDSVYRWFDQYPDFLANYRVARLDRAAWRADNMDAISDMLLAGKIDHNTARVLIDKEKWASGKEDPKAYGDKVQQEITGEMKVSGAVENLAKLLTPEQLMEIRSKLTE